MINNIFSLLFVYFYKDSHTDNVFRRNSIKLAYIGKFYFMFINVLHNNIYFLIILIILISMLKHAKAARNINLKSIFVIL